MPDNIPRIPPAVTKLVEKDRTWYEQADDWTWWWLRAQRNRRTWSDLPGGCAIQLPLTRQVPIAGGRDKSLPI